MIVGKRILLRAVEREDLPLMVVWRNDPAIYQHFYEHEPLSQIMQERWFEAFLDKPDEKLWVIQDIASGTPIGTVGLVHIDTRSNKAEWGRFLIYPDEYRHGGYGSETEALVLRYVFDTMNLHRLQCEVFSDNEAVIGLHQKFGFQVEGVFRDYVFKDGAYRDVTYLAMLREGYDSAATQERIRRYIGE